MAGKITIRRIGSILPTVCLLLFMALCVGTVWLSTLGVPDAVLRYVERKAAENGVSLHIGSLRLYPARGLAVRAEDILVYSSAESKEPLASIGSVAAGLNLSQLLFGRVKPSHFMIEQGKLMLPVTEPAGGKKLVLDDVGLSARFEREGAAQITSGHVRVQGIPVRVQGIFDLNMLSSSGGASSSSSSAELSLTDYITRYQDIINKVYYYIEEQHWSPEQLPSLDVRLAVQEEFRISAHCNIPSFNLGQFHFRDVLVDLQHNRDSITINSLKFRTVDPDASASFQGGYDLLKRHLEFRMDSTSSLLRMVRFVSDGELQEYLYKFRHPDDSPPHITMSGDISFEQDYTLHSARVLGKVEQKNLRVGKTLIDNIELSFFYDNGNFSIDKLELRFPDGSLQCVAAAQDGVGQAQLVADLPVQKVLTIVRDLGVEDLALPEGLELGERVQLNTHAQLTAPAFKPGRSQWQGFVPSFHMVAAEVTTDLLSYRGYRLSSPSVLLQFSDIRQERDLMLHSIDASSLKITSEQVDIPLDAENVLSLKSPELRLNLSKLICGEDSVPQAVQEAVATLQIRSADMPGDRSLAEMQLELRLRNMSFEPGEVETCLKASALSVRAEVERATAGELKVGRVEATMENEFATACPLIEVISSSHVQATANELVQGETQLGNATFSFELPKHGVGKFSFELAPPGGEAVCYLYATPEYMGNNLIMLNRVEAELPNSALSLLPQALGVQFEEMEMPKYVSLNGACLIAIDPFELRDAVFKVSIPELVRTPHTVNMFKGERIPIGIKADIILSTDRDSVLTYRTSLEVTHRTGVFKGDVNGSSLGTLRVTGDNTIRPDIVDMLIDNARTHSIIRDFRFPENARAKITNINTFVDYSDGVKVDSVCDVELFNSEYLICVIEEDGQGKEFMRTDLSSNPYTLVEHGKCKVLVDVSVGAHTESGAKIADRIAVTIRDIVLDYDNTPWLKRQGFSGGVRSTRLLGDSVLIDVEHSFVELKNVRGTVYPAYSLGMFYPDLQHYMEDVVLPEPAQVSSPHCVFPIFDDCVRPMSGVIQLMAPRSAAFRFIGTSIPLEDFSGFVYIADDYVQLDRMNAKSWEGVLDATVKIGFAGKSVDFDGYVKAQCMNLEKIAASYGSKQSPALCNGEIRFRSPSARLVDLKAYGQLEVDNGNLMTLSLFKPIGSLLSDMPTYFTRLEREANGTSDQPAEKPGFISRMFTGFFKGVGTVVGKAGDSVGAVTSNVPLVNHIIAYDLQGAHTKFDIINGYFITRNMHAEGSNLDIKLNLSINLDTLELKGNLWPRISSLPTVVLSPLTFLSDFMININLYGKVTDLQWGIGLSERQPSQPASATSKPKKKKKP